MQLLTFNYGLITDDFQSAVRALNEELLNLVALDLIHVSPKIKEAKIGGPTMIYSLDTIIKGSFSQKKRTFHLHRPDRGLFSM